MRQLIAGNWKMNGLRGRGGRAWRARCASGAAGLACDLLVCPPATVLARGGRGAGGQRGRGRRPGLPRRAARRRIPATSRPRCCATPGATLGDPRPFRAPRRPWRDRRAGARARRVAAVAAGLTPIVCVGETEQQRLAGRPRPRWSAAQIDGSLPHGLRRRGRLRADLGDRHRPHRDRGGRGGDARAASASSCVRQLGRGRGGGAHPVWRLGQARQRRRRCWRCRRWAARWSAARAWSPADFLAIAARRRSSRPLGALPNRRCAAA